MSKSKVAFLGAHGAKVNSGWHKFSFIGSILRDATAAIASTIISQHEKQKRSSLSISISGYTNTTYNPRKKLKAFLEQQSDLLALLANTEQQQGKQL